MSLVEGYRKTLSESEPEANGELSVNICPDT